MRPRVTSRTFWLLVTLALCLAFPYTAKVQRYFGTVWIPVQLVVVFLAVLAGYRYVLPWFPKRVTPGVAVALMVLTVAVLVGAFAVVYPRADYIIAGGGSDRDQALNAATTELLHGRYPYYPRTGVGTADQEPRPVGPISPMPGALMFAVPFALLGNAVYQNFFWLVVLLVVLTKQLKDTRRALLFFWMVLVLSPICVHEVVTGGDLLANSLWVFVLTVLTVRHVGDRETGVAVQLLLAVLFGMGLSSRVNFVLVGPLVLSALVQTAGWRPAVRFVSVAAAAWLVVTLPFYLYDPQGFSPLHAFGKLDWFRGILPFSRWLVPAAGAALAVGLSFQKMDERRLVLYRNCAVVLGWPVACTVVLCCIRDGARGIELFAWYGLSFLFFAVLVCWVKLTTEAPAAASCPRGAAIGADG